MEERYCHECGSPLTPDATFCPACGANVNTDGTADQVVNDPAVGGIPYTAPPRTNNRKTITILCLVWGIGGLIFGLYMYLTAGSLADTAVEQMKNMTYSGTQTYWDLMVENGFDRDLFVTLYQIVGLSMALSAFMALIGAHFIHYGTHYKIALLALILSSIFAAMELITLVIGLVVTYKLTKYKSEFAS